MVPCLAARGPLDRDGCGLQKPYPTGKGFRPARREHVFERPATRQEEAHGLRAQQVAMLHPVDQALSGEAFGPVESALSCSGISGHGDFPRAPGE
jgi:hypothetical protein